MTALDMELERGDSWEAPEGEGTGGARHRPHERGVIPYLPQEVDEFETEVIRFRKGEADGARFRSFRLVRGVYGQRQPDVYMLRVKIPFGRLTAPQVEALGQVAAEHVHLQKGHVTTRENIQFHFVKLEKAPEVMRLLGGVGLTTREACGNTVRNVTGCPLAGVTPDEPFYVSPYAAAYARWFVRQPLTQRLPRKFKTAFESCQRDCVVTSIHDLGFLPRLQQDEQGRPRHGFRMVVGGSTSIMPRLAYTLFDFVPVEEYLKVSEAVLRVFNRCDELRRNLMRARLKFYIHRIGIEAFRREVEEELKADWARKDFSPARFMELEDESREAPAPVVGASTDGHGDAVFIAWRESNVLPQKQPGYDVVFVKLPLGDIQAQQFPALARIIRQYGAGELRTTNQQNLALRWVPDAYLYPVWQELVATGLGEPAIHQITDIVACPGTDSCKLGITSSMGLGHAVREALSQMHIDDPLTRAIHIKISGCPNGCGQHHIANIGLHGAATRRDGHQVPAYEIFLGGNYGEGEDSARIGQRLRGRVPARRVPELVREIIGFYQGNRRDGETFNQLVARLGLEPFEALVARFSDPGPLVRGNIAMYMDWGKTVLFKVERGEGECAV
jgi:sulfite reductase beta subunit-like hemoprotein